MEKNPAAGDHLPGFITGPGDTDILFVVTTILMIAAVLGIGNLYLRLHALPEQIAHKSQKIQFELVAVLALLALFTHNHLFWVAGLILAFIEIPDFGTPMRSMAASLARMAGREPPASNLPDGEQAAAALSPPLPSEAPMPEPAPDRPPAKPAADR